jgi:hypothetical protein
MLLHVKLARVKAPGVSECGKLASRKDLLQEFSCRETAIHGQSSVAVRGGLGGQDAQQLGNIRTNADTRVPNSEELIDETTTSDENCANDPGTKCAGRHIWVIMVVDHSTDLSVGRTLHALY